jgi:hypothetical protein
LLERKSFPEMTEAVDRASGLLSSVSIRFVVVEYRVSCTVAPRKESIYIGISAKSQETRDEHSRGTLGHQKGNLAE